MPHFREEFLRKYCDTCSKPVAHLGCGIKFQQIFEPIHCPEELEITHQVCPFCLDLFAKNKRHNEFCPFIKNGIQLHSIGWSTSASVTVLQSIRKSTCQYFEPLENLLTQFFIDFELQDIVVVPVPLGSPKYWARWQESLKKATANLKGIEVVPVIHREKQISTRKSAAQIRNKIANEEYRVLDDHSKLLERKRVVLLDDNVTTGNTILRCADMLKNCNPSEIFILSLERTVSPRVLQRCKVLSDLECPYKAPIITEPAY